MLENIADNVVSVNVLVIIQQKPVSEALSLCKEHVLTEGVIELSVDVVLNHFFFTLATIFILLLIAFFIIYVDILILILIVSYRLL